MKKIIALVLSILMVVGLFAACGSDKKDDNKTTPETTEAPAQTTTNPLYDDNYSKNY